MEPPGAIFFVTLGVERAVIVIGDKRKVARRPFT